MKLALIVAAAKNGVIGCDNQLPWHLPQDLKYFKAITLGKPIIMGRKTYESIGKPLPGRTNIVVTRNRDWVAADGVIVTNSFESALAEARLVSNNQLSPVDEIMVIGGAEMYRAAISQADRIYLTLVDVEPQGDAFFMPLNKDIWALVSKVAGDNLASLRHEFLVYDRISLEGNC